VEVILIYFRNYVGSTEREWGNTQYEHSLIATWLVFINFYE